MPSSGSNPRPNQNAAVDARGAGVRRRGLTADRGTRRAIANVVTDNQVEAVGPPGGTAVGNGRVKIEAPVVGMVACDLDLSQ